jgi:aspartate ammonia-lyase
LNTGTTSGYCAEGLLVRQRTGRATLSTAYGDRRGIQNRSRVLDPFRTQLADVRKETDSLGVSYALLKKAVATANHTSGRLDGSRHSLIVRACDEILAGQHHEMFPLHVWMTGSGTRLLIMKFDHAL